jgi:cytochrome c biogenesis protein CcmG, thiol:disulfide interchange protein DsbE
LLLAVAAAVLLAAVPAVLFVRSDGEPRAAARDTAPAVRLPDLRRASATVDLAGFRGRPVVVNFFAAWCTPCREELPLLRAAHSRLAGRVEFLGIDHLDDRDKAVALLDRFQITYPAGFDPEGEVARHFRLRGLPSTVFIDADGRIVGTVAGQLTQASLDGFLSKLVGRNPS